MASAAPKNPTIEEQKSAAHDAAQALAGAGIGNAPASASFSLADGERMAKRVAELEQLVLEGIESPKPEGKQLIGRTVIVREATSGPDHFVAGIITGSPKMVRPTNSASYVNHPVMVFSLVGGTYSGWFRQTDIAEPGPLEFVLAQ